MVRRRGGACAVFVLAGFLSNCGGFVVTPERSSASLPTVREALEKAESGDRVGAIADLEARQVAQPTPTVALYIGMLAFLEGRPEEALGAYRSYLASGDPLEEWDKAAVGEEIQRIEAALETKQPLGGASLASARLRGELARMRAEAALENRDYPTAFLQMKTASQYLQDTALILESALAATKAEAYADAAALFRLYLSKTPQGSRERAYEIQTEVERLQSILAGQEPSTFESLADQIYKDREIRDRAAAVVGETGPAASVEVESSPETAAADAPVGGYHKVETGDGAAPVNGPSDSKERQATIEELIVYAKTGSSAVRFRAVRELTKKRDDRARGLLEDRVMNDSNLQVRLVAVEGLVVRRSVRSLPLLRQALLTAATSQERASIRDAIGKISLGSKATTLH